MCDSCGFYYLIIQDRPHISEDIQCYLNGSATYPLVVHGPNGHGKTLLMAAAAYHLREANPGIKMTIVVRFIGLSPKSSTIFNTLRSIAEQVRQKQNGIAENKIIHPLHATRECGNVLFGTGN